MADYAKSLNDALAEVIATRKALMTQQEMTLKAAEAHETAVAKARDLRDKLNNQVNEALASVGIDKADPRVHSSK